MFDLAITTIAMLAAAAFAAGFVDSIAGGGGLISVPALLLAGFTPVESLGTNKLQGLFGTGSATLAYAASGQVDPRRQWRAAVLSFFGATLGALTATRVPDDVLRAALPIVLIAIALYFALKPNLADVDRAERLSPLRFSATLVPLIGFYDGVFGPGAGSFFMLAFVALAGYGVLKATAHTKLLNFASNIGGFAVFGGCGANRDIIIGAAIAMYENRTRALRVIFFRAVNGAIVEENRIARSAAQGQGTFPRPFASVQTQMRKRINVFQRAKVMRTGHNVQRAIV